MKYLKLRLAGVMQSFGSEKTVWAEYRGTEMAPTKSAVAGLIACALGIKKTEKEYDDLKAFKMYYEDKSENIVKLTDYQMVNPKEPGKSYKDSRFYSLNGSHTKTQMPIRKTYLTNAKFDVYIGCENEEYLKKIHAGFLNPKWPLYIGRACCPPSEMIVTGEFNLLSGEEVAKKEVFKCISTY